MKERRFQRMMERQNERKAERKAASVAALRERQDPFSFYSREMDRLRRLHEEREHAKQAHLDALRRQRPRPSSRGVPKSARESRYEDMQRERENRREERKRQAEELLQRAEAPVSNPDSKTKGQSRSTRKVMFRPQRQRFRAKPVPDFAHLQERAQADLSAKRKERPPTQPQPFHLAHKGKYPPTRQQEPAHITSPPFRWPYFDSDEGGGSDTRHQTASPRQAEIPFAAETKAQQLRRQAVSKRFWPFKYEEAKEQKAAESEKERRRLAKRKEHAWRQVHARMQETSGETIDAPDRSGEDARDAGVPGFPRQYVRHRHRQAQEQARAAVEEVLLEHDLYNYIEESENQR